MPALNFFHIFGNAFNNNFTETGDPATSWYEVSFALNSFVDVGGAETDGEILNGLGISDLTTNTSAYYAPNNKAVNVLYGILLLVRQNQAANINEDPEQKIFVAEQAPRLGVGSRSGQIQRSFTVSFFTDTNIASTPDIDDL